MGRFLAQVDPKAEKKLTESYSDSNSVFDADGYLTAYSANGVDYTSITYDTDFGVNADFSGSFKRVTGWTEVNDGLTQVITVTYAESGRVDTVTVS